MNYYGMLVCRERLERNWSQEGLCRGICAVSYLSKIETGRAEPSREILALLLERLGLRTDAGLEQRAARLAEEGYELLFSGRGHELGRLLGEGVEDLRAAPAGLDLLLLAELAVRPGQPADHRLEGCMSPRQLALQRILQGRYEEALLRLPNGYTYWRAGTAAYEAGSYTAAIEHLERGYALAAEEGAARLMLLCRVFIGNSYCNQRDFEAMARHYRVARRLAAALGEEGILADIAYNTASAQIEAGRYEEAYRHFSALEEPNIMSLHKLAICCEKTGRREEALAALDRADTLEGPQPGTGLARKLCALVRYRLNHPDYLAREEYGRLLMECFEACRRELPMGYATFHLPWVAEWLTATRQYKRAYELMRDFPKKSELI